MTRLHDVLYFLRQIFFPNWIDREDDDGPTGWQRFLALLFLFLTSRDGTGTLFSIVLHAFVLVILSLIIMKPQLGNLVGIDILGNWNVPSMEQPVTIAPAQDEQATDNSESNVAKEESTPDIPETENPIEQPAISTGATETIIDPAPGLSDEERQKIHNIGGFVDGGGFQNRNQAGRQRAMQGSGSSRGSEAAVEAALAWLAYHQQTDGGWSFHFTDSCEQCSRSGTSPTNRRTAATALALMAFLGAGYSHQVESQYRLNVQNGLLFLIDNPNGGFEGMAIRQDGMQMYSQGLAAIALCEAYAMNREQDPTSTLGRAAQRSLRYIEMAQDRDFGGWNYRPEQIRRRNIFIDGDEVRIGGDTSIFAWQLMALKSGKIGGLHVSQSVLYAAQDFLDLVALDGGRHYNYVQTGTWDRDRGIDSPKTCTAIGLLMRMYLGWKPGDPFLDDGMDTLARWTYQPRTGAVNLYYAYYATLALHHYGGEHWDTWNSGLQELLIRTQSRENCESGSWYFPDGYCDSGGRLLNTALGAMILETPYRIMPLYREIR